MANLLCSHKVSALRLASASRKPAPLRRTPALLVKAQAPAGAAAPAAPASYSSSSTNGYAQPVTVNFPEQLPGVLAPAANYQNVVKMGVRKAQQPAAALFISGVLAGAFIAFGAFLTCSVQGGIQSLVPTLPGVVKLIGGLIFPVGLTLVVLGGVELYTGNTAVMPMSVYEKQVSVGGLFHNWFWSYFGNFVGSLMMVAAVAATGILAGNPVPINMAEMKAGLPWMTAFIRSILCNWLVCMAVWNAAAATSLSGKMLGLWGPIATFVTIGLEHSVANMFFIPMGIVLGAKVTFSEFLWNNLLPVTLGNTIGGFVFVGTAFAFLFGSLGKRQPPPAAAK